ncbi:MAG: 5-dehydro-4-deoxy-D-glucuronate isomerase [Bacteroidales bacterium]
METHFDLRFASHPSDVKSYDTKRLRDEFLVDTLMVKGEIRQVYSMYDRFLVGGAVPLNKALDLLPVDALKATFFLHRRELGIINVGGPARIVSGSEEFELQFKEALYLGCSERNVSFHSVSRNQPARLYFNSAPAHHSYPDKRIDKSMAEVVQLGSLETSNARTLNKLLVHPLVQTCQLQMGLTELKPGSVWNTMPPHTHARRMEAYFYFEVPAGQAVCHFMGSPDETRHIWMSDEQAVLSPSWSIHSAAGTSNYCFIWGMAGENLDYGDMDVTSPDKLR